MKRVELEPAAAPPVTFPQFREDSAYLILSPIAYQSMMLTLFGCLWPLPLLFLFPLKP